MHCCLTGIPVTGFVGIDARVGGVIIFTGVGIDELCSLFLRLENGLDKL